MESLSAYHRRWYDRIDDLTLAMALSQYLPIEIQMVIARNLNEAIDMQRNASRLNLKQPISVNPLPVLGLYQASKRQRWYDLNLRLSRAYNFMGTLPEPYLIRFAGHVIVTARDIQNIREQNRRESLIACGDTRLAALSILQRQAVRFTESDEGFRLVKQALGHDAKTNRPASF